MNKKDNLVSHESDKQERTILSGKTRLQIGIAVLGLGLLALQYVPDLTNSTRSNNMGAKAEVSLPGALPILQPTIRYGFVLDTFKVEESEFKSGQVLGDILHKVGLTHAQIQTLVENHKDILDITKIRPGQTYVTLRDDETSEGEYLIYEPDVFGYYVFHLQDSIRIERVNRPIVREQKAIHGTMQGSLWAAMADAGASYELIDKLEDALQWTLDFHRINDGDEFEVVYEQLFIEGKPVGIGQVFAAHYKEAKSEKEHAAIHFEGASFTGYYSLEGRPNKKSFLKAPLKFSRISSGFNLRRFHPILKETRPHYGTDYAAPYGTPIQAVGDGVITEAQRKGGNGNYVRIRHDGTYETQYLHMQGFANGIRPGVAVKQGDIIGYVGSTGLATGPHVCFRFWKNGQQVNHLALNLPDAQPLQGDEMTTFSKQRDTYLAMMEAAKVKKKNTPSDDKEAEASVAP